MSKSYTPPDKSTYDPGWNDPPAMLSGQAATTTVKGRLSLNKRVAFPMQNSAPSTIPNMKTADSGLPLPYSTAKYNPIALSTTAAAAPPPSISSIRPPTAASPPIGALLVQPTIQPSSHATAPVAAFKTVVPPNVREFCYRIFSNELKSSTAPLDTTKTIEIERRLEILNNMWSNETFSNDIEDQLFRIAQALEQNDIPLALKLHRLLIMNHTAICTEWGTALRQLILLNEMEHSVASSTAVEDQAPPALLNVSANEVPGQIDLSTSNIQKKVGAIRFGPIQHL